MDRGGERPVSPRLPVLSAAERAEIARLWERKLEQERRGLPRSDRHRNLEPVSAELLAVLAAGCGAERLLEVGGSSGLSTIALAAAARASGARLTSIEIEPMRQAEARETLTRLGLIAHATLVCADAAAVLPSLAPSGLVLLDCEKLDYVRFARMLNLVEGGLIVADNVISHDMKDWIHWVRARDGAESVTLPVGKGIEITRLPRGLQAGRSASQAGG